ncbi:MAG: phenylacetate-CoA oxygenase subunit PaaJ [Gammaproteobacteria bacterium]|nr:MAG: phenylacetate-CoA oxygenase subunit PaaJ [Gammaproteobacteria bacterium]PCI66681.1 MAG: phenylacetate-CoA oxygenase subunit PaaJ [Gammaproteobacteria bacterium]
MNDVISIVTPEFASRKAYRNASVIPALWDILDNVFDPELPGLTIWDLGILQDVSEKNDAVLVTVTPTYSGCPAVDTIITDIETELFKFGHKKVEVKVTLSPAWTTDMMSPTGKAHLKSIQIAPPEKNDRVCCPVCESENTKVLSQFGSTSCKSLYQCNDCFEAFDYFKHF